MPKTRVEATKAIEPPETSRITRNSRYVLGDVSNDTRRRTRSLTAKNPAAAVPEEPQETGSRRRSARLETKQEATEAPSDEEAHPAQPVAENPAVARKPAAQPKRTSLRAPLHPKSKAASRKRPPLEVEPSFEPARKVSRHNRTAKKSAPFAPRPPLEVDEGENYDLACYPMDPSRYTSGLSQYDIGSRGDVLATPEYVCDIFQGLYHAETRNRPRPYLHEKEDVNPTMRAILVDWIVEVHTKFRLDAATLHLCISILDRYLAKSNITRSRLQLAGVTALLVACKYEEIYPPLIKDCVYITDRAFTAQEVLDMEQDILRVLSFKLTVPTCHPFIQRFLFIIKASPTMASASHYYAERMLQEHEYLEFRPSLVAAASVCLACNHPGIRETDDVRGAKPGVPKLLLQYTGYPAELILEAATVIATKVSEEVVTVSRRSLTSVKRKYEERRYNYVSESIDPPSAEDIVSSV